MTASGYGSDGFWGSDSGSRPYTIETQKVTLDKFDMGNYSARFLTSDIGFLIGGLYEVSG